MIADRTILRMKYVDIVKTLSERTGCTLDEALEWMSQEKNHTHTLRNLDRTIDIPQSIMVYFAVT